MIERRLITTNLIAKIGIFACIWKLASRADMSVDIVQKAHPAAKGPMSTRVIENIVSEMEMFEIIYVTKEDLKSVKFSLM